MTIQELPLAWRWTQTTHSVLPAGVLAEIRPLEPSEAANVRLGGSAAQTPSVTRVADHHAEVRSWLRDIQPDEEAAVYVVWRQDLAVETTWGIFTEYWDDFCYPSSDDVTISPVTGAWQLVYHHYEQFDFIAGS